MRKTLILGALALMASTTVASAVTLVSLDGYCNQYAFRYHTGQFTMKDTGCSNAIGGGLLGSIHGEGKAAVMALTDPGNPTTQFVFKFSYPFVTGGTWTLYSTSNGTSLTTVLSGNYTIPNAGEPSLKGPKSVTSR